MVEVLPAEFRVPQSVERVQVVEVSHQIHKMDYVARTKAGQRISFTLDDARPEQLQGGDAITTCSLLLTELLQNGKAQDGSA